MLGVTLGVLRLSLGVLGVSLGVLRAILGVLGISLDVLRVGLGMLMLIWTCWRSAWGAGSHFPSANLGCPCMQPNHVSS